MRARYGIASCFFVALLAASPSAGAQAQGQGLSAQDEANARFQTGLKYYDNHDFESARLAFKQAYAVLQKPSILLNLALSELYSNHPLDAIVHFEEYMKDPSTPPDKRDKSRKSLEEAMKKTAHLQIRTAMDAQVTVDGRPVPPPYTSAIHVMPGAHSVEARLASKTKSANVDPKPGDTVPIDLTFEGEPSSPPPVDPTPVQNRGLPAPETKDQTASSPPPVQPEPSSWSTMKTIAVASWVGALGAGITGGVLLDASGDKADEGRRATEGIPSCVGVSSAQCDAGSAAASSSADLKTAGLISLVGAGALTVTGFVLFFWPRKSASLATTRVVIEGSGLGLVHRF